MNTKEKEQYLARLKEEIKATEELLVALNEANKPVSPDVAIGRISRMDAINNKSITDNQVRQNKGKLTKLKLILKSEKSEEFGNCLRCKKPIPLLRLMYMPQSRNCVNCAR